MAVRLRDYCAADHDAVVELSLRAWTPVFASMEAVVCLVEHSLVGGVARGWAAGITTPGEDPVDHLLQAADEAQQIMEVEHEPCS